MLKSLTLNGCHIRLRVIAVGGFYLYVKILVIFGSYNVDAFIHHDAGSIIASKKKLTQDSMLTSLARNPSYKLRL